MSGTKVTFTTKKETGTGTVNAVQKHESGSNQYVISKNSGGKITVFASQTKPIGSPAGGAGAAPAAPAAAAASNYGAAAPLPFGAEGIPQFTEQQMFSMFKQNGSLLAMVNLMLPLYDTAPMTEKELAVYIESPEINTVNELVYAYLQDLKEIEPNPNTNVYNETVVSRRRSRKSRRKSLRTARR
jgi:hypothetical protein